MKLTPAFSRISIFVFAALAVATFRTARAESDYEYAKQLMDINSPSFSTDDLIERLSVRLGESASTTTKMEAKLIKAAQLRRKAMDSTADKQIELLKQSSELYKDVVAGDRKFRLYETAVKDSDSIAQDVIKAHIKAAKDNPAEQKRYRAEAGAMFEKKANEKKAEAEAAYPAFQAALKAFNDEMKRLNPKNEGERMPGPAFIDKLDKAFFAWIVPDQLYVSMKVKQVDALDESDGDRKKIVTDVTGHCKKRIDDEVLGNFPDISARYSYFQGALYAAIGNEDEAAKSWNDVLEVDLTQQTNDVKKQIMPLIKLVVHDLIKMKMRSKKYSDVEEYIIKIRTGPLREIFDEDIGKELIIDLAKALTIPAETAGDYEKAVKELRTAIGKERAGSTWSNDFSRTMAEILIDARSKKIYPHLSAVEWYDAAHGMSLYGTYIYTQQYEKLNASADPADKEKAAAKFEEAYKEFANAVDYYRRAISEARKPATDLATRLDVEPKSWFEMGLSYVRMKHDYEAIIAYKAMRDSFLPENRKLWLPSEKDTKSMTKAVKTAIAILDLPAEKNGMLAKSGKNIDYALSSNEREHKDQWNISLRSKILRDLSGGAQGFVLNPDNITDNDYIVADIDAKGAANFTENAKKAEAEARTAGVDTDAGKKKMDVAGDLWNSAVQKHISAAEKFTKVKSKEVYDFALVHYAFNYTQAQKIVSEGVIPVKLMPAAEQTAKGKEYAQKALEGYKKYEDYITQNPSTDEKVLARRKKAQGIILLAKNSLYVGSGDWAKAVESSDEYVAYEAENPKTPSLVHIAYLNKFRALLSLAAAAQAPACDPYLANANAAMQDLHNVNPNDKNLYVFMLKVLSDRYNVAAYQLEAKRKADPGISKEEAEKLDDMISKYENKVANLQSERVDQMELGKQEKDELTLDDYSRLVYLFNKTGQTRKAADTAIKLLKKFDPNNKNMVMPDDEKTWRPFLDQMIGVINYESIALRDRCIKEHSVLVDYMYDTDAGMQLEENDKKRPAWDQLNENTEKALAKLESLKNKNGEFKDCQTLKVGPKGSTKSYLGIIEDEIQFRRKIMAARDLLAELALVVAKKLGKEGKEEASLEYMKVAKEQIEILKEKKGESAAIEIKVAEIDIAIGKSEDAMIRLNNTLPRLDPAGRLYFYAKRLISEIFAEQKKWAEAADYPSFVYITQGLNSDTVKQRWPDMKGFLKLCADNGAKVPPGLKKIFDAEKEGGEQPEAPKPDAPKAETPKVDAAKEQGK